MPIRGCPGEERWIWLRLKLIADAGLVGLPNAGKSTFLARVSAARPKIADYPFTTLAPNLGVVELSSSQRFVIADVPGLIEGASEGAGLGTRFLGHLERTKVLVHLIDGTEPDVGVAYRTIREELAAYGGGLVDKPELVVLNKVDALAEDERLLRARELTLASGREPFLLSGVSGEGVRALLAAVWVEIASGREEARDLSAPDSWAP